VKIRYDIATVPYEAVDALVDTDPIALRDLAWTAIEKAREGSEDARLSNAEATVEKLRADLVAIRDIAYRAEPRSVEWAIEEIRLRAARAASQE
jgi:hypothetical protein